MPRRVRLPRLLLTLLGAAAALAAAFALGPLALEEWFIHKLDSPDLAERSRAVERLGEMRSVRAVPRLLEVRDGEECRKAVIASLVRMGPRALPALHRALRAEETEARYTAAMALLELRPQGRTWIDLNLTLLEIGPVGDDRESMEAAALALKRVSPLPVDVIERLTRALEAENPPDWIFELLGAQGSAAEMAIPQLISLYSSGGNHSYQASTALAEIGTPAVGPILETLAGADLDSRKKIIKLLESIGPKARQAAPALSRLILDPECGWEALDALGKVSVEDGEARECAPGLARRLVSSAGRLRWRITLALAEMGPEAIPHLVPHLQSEDEDLVSDVIYILAEIGEEARAAAPALLEAIDAGDPVLRFQASRALLAIDGRTERYIREIAAGLGELPDDACSEALDVLDLLNDAAGASIPYLIELLRERSGLFPEYQICSVLQDLGPAAGAAIPVLEEMLEKDPLDLQAAEALWAIARSPEVPRKAIRLLDSTDPEVRRDAIHLVSVLGPSAPEAVPKLIDLLDDASCRESAAWVLGRLGPPAAPAVPGLAELLADPVSGACNYAVEALGEIGPEAGPAAGRIAGLIEERGFGGRWGMIPEALEKIGPSAGPAAPVLLEILREAKSDSVRRSALDALGALGSAASGALPEIGESLADDASEIRVEAARTLWRIEKRAGGILPALIPIIGERCSWGEPPEALDEDEYSHFGFISYFGSGCPVSEETLEGALQLLGEMGPEAEAAVSALRQVAAAQELGARLHASWALRNVTGEDEPLVEACMRILEDGTHRRILGLVNYLDERELWISIGPRLAPSFARLLKHESYRSRRAAARALGKIGPRPGEVVPALAGALRDRHHRVRVEAAAALAGMGLPASGALIELLGDDDGDLRARAARALSRMGEPIVPELIRLLGGKEPDLRRGAVAALRDLGPRAGAAIPALIESLDGDDDLLRALAAEALGAVGRDAAAPLVRTVESGDPRARRAACDAIAWIGPGAREALPALRKILGHPDASLRLRAAAALLRVEPQSEDSIPALAAVLRDGDPLERARAARALGSCGPRARAAAPALLQALRDGDGSVRRAAAAALERMIPAVPEAAGAEPDLRRLLADPSAGVRRSAARTLGMLGPIARDAGPGLVGLLDDGDREVRLAALQALGRIGPGVREVIPALLEAFEDEDRAVALGAIEALGKMGPEAAGAIPALIHALGVEDTQLPAASVLGNLGPLALEAVPALLRELELSRRLPWGSTEELSGALRKIDPGSLEAETRDREP